MNDRSRPQPVNDTSSDLLADWPGPIECVAREFYAQRYFLALAGIHVAATALFLLLTDRAGYLSFTLYLSNEFHYIILGLIAYGVGVAAVYRWVRYDIQAMYALFEAWGQRLCRGLPVLLVLPFVLSTFSSVKSTILRLRPATLDSELAAIDNFVHGGVDPWALIQPVLGNPAITRAIDALYVWWIPILVLVTYWQLFQGYDLKARFQYLVSIVLVWFVLGNVLAALLASGGPMYFGELTGNTDRFGALFSYLRDVDVVALDIQARLWEGYVSGTPGEYYGISAMPSVHVAIAVCMALAAWRYSRWSGWAMSCYAVVILIGSVHLGWHYAIDGYLSILFVPLFWWAAGRLYDGLRPRSSQFA